MGLNESVDTWDRQFSTDRPDRPKVLVVDDDVSTRLMVRQVLGPAGFEIEEADGGRRGLELIESFRPDIVLLDILMPEMDGFATLRSLRGQDHGSGCHVVMVTGLQDPGAVETALELGATDFVTKPINWGLLRHRLNYVLRSSVERQAHRMDRPAHAWETQESALRLAGVGTWQWDPKTDRLTVCDRFLRVLGMRRREPLTSRFVLARIHRDDRDRVRRVLRQWISGTGEGVVEASFRVVVRGGPDSVVRLRAEAIQGDGLGLAGIIEDISEKEDLERKLHDLQASARRIRNLTQDLIDPSHDEGETT
jgi:PAS domain S-box-containing protein